MREALCDNLYLAGKFLLLNERQTAKMVQMNLVENKMLPLSHVFQASKPILVCLSQDRTGTVWVREGSLQGYIERSPGYQHGEK